MNTSINIFSKDILTFGHKNMELCEKNSDQARLVTLSPHLILHTCLVEWKQKHENEVNI